MIDLISLPSAAPATHYEEVGEDGHLALRPVTDDGQRAEIEAAMTRLSFTGWALEPVTR